MDSILMFWLSTRNTEKFCVIHAFTKGWIEHYLAPDMNLSSKKNKVLYPAAQHLQFSKSNSEEDQVL